MADAMYVAATGMRAHQTEVDAISNNIANLNTVGYRGETVSFSALTSAMAAEVGELDSPAGIVAPQGEGTLALLGLSTGAGALKPTGDPLNIAIDGAGFLEVVREDGSLAYTRAGALRVNAEGLMTTLTGQPLAAQLVIPTEATAVQILPDGRVFAQLGTNASPVEVGQIELASFVNTGALTAVGQGLYLASADAGQPVLAKPGENGLGTLKQGYLELSNVELTDQMVALMIAQRAFEMNSRVFQVADQMLSITNGLAKA